MSDRIDQLASAFDSNLVDTTKERVAHILSSDPSHLTSWLDQNDPPTSLLVSDAISQGHWYARWAGYAHSSDSIGGLLTSRPSFDTALEAAQHSVRRLKLPRTKKQKAYLVKTIEVRIPLLGKRQVSEPQSPTVQTEMWFSAATERRLWGLFPAAINFLRIIIDRHGSAYISANKAQQILIDKFIEALGWAPDSGPFMALPCISLPNTSIEPPDSENVWRGVVTAKKAGDPIAKIVHQEALARQKADSGEGAERTAVLNRRRNRSGPSNKKKKRAKKNKQSNISEPSSSDRWYPPKRQPARPKPEPDNQIPVKTQANIDRAAKFCPLDQTVGHKGFDQTFHEALLRKTASKVIESWWHHNPFRYWVDYFHGWTGGGLNMEGDKSGQLVKCYNYVDRVLLKPRGLALYHELIPILTAAYGKKLLDRYEATFDHPGNANVPGISDIEVAWQWTRATWKAAHDIASNWNFELMPPERVDELRAKDLAKRLRLSKGTVRTPVIDLRSREDRTEFLEFVVADAREGDPFALMIVEAIPARVRPSLDPEQ